MIFQRAVIIFTKNLLLRKIFFREETDFCALTHSSSRSFHRTRSRRYAANCVAQRRSVVLLAQVYLIVISSEVSVANEVEKSLPHYIHEKSCFAIFFREETTFLAVPERESGMSEANAERVYESLLSPPQSRLRLLRLRLVPRLENQNSARGDSSPTGAPRIK